LSENELLNQVAEAVLSFDENKVIEAVRIALKNGVSPIDIIEKGLTKGLRTVGDKFETGEFFLMHMVAAAEITKKAIDKILQPELSKSKTQRKALGKVVIGTVAGDIHDIGKNIVAAMLLSAGFEVYDLGKDVPAEEFVKKVREVDADVVALSALLSTTLPMQRVVIEALESSGLREKVKVIVGGAPVTKEWAEEIGADGYAENAIEAVNVLKRLLNLT
jgi:corrinoid protein of di/trimethylamine methyltransferase